MSIRTVKVINVSVDTSEQHVVGYFSFYGDIERVEMLSSGNVTSKIAYVTFKDSQGAEAALHLSDATIDDHPVIITPAAPDYVSALLASAAPGDAITPAPDYGSLPGASGGPLASSRRSGSAVRRTVGFLDDAFKKTMRFGIKHRPKVNLEYDIFSYGGFNASVGKSV